MHDDSVPTLDHGRDKGSVEADRRHQVLLYLPVPGLVVERRKAAARGARAAEYVDDDVDTPERRNRCPGQVGASGG